MRALHETGFSNMPTSISAKHGLILKNIFITSCIRCAPPSNKLLNLQLLNCSNYLARELELLRNVRVVICLGLIAFHIYCRINNLKKPPFYVFANHIVNDKHLIASYNPVGKVQIRKC